MTARAKHYAQMYDMFEASISKKVDCGKMCAPLNGGSPVCCSTDHAVPIVTTSEYKHLKTVTDAWKKYKPKDKAGREIVDELHEDCRAIECKIAPYCDRVSRTLACRAFPFFPYFTKEEELIGLSYYWTFEDRCWVISNLKVVEPEFVKEMIETYEYLFKKDRDEKEAMVDQSKSMRKSFGKKGRPIPIIGRDGNYYKVMPKTKGKVVPASLAEFGALEPFTSDKAYHKAIKEEGGDPTGHSLKDAGV